MSDFISRQDAISAVVNTSIPYCTFGKKSREYNALKRDAVYAIKALPAEPVKGEWLPFEYGDDTWHKCSVCGVADRYVEVCQRPDGTIGRTAYVRNFCPNCGADMRGK